MIEQKIAHVYSSALLNIAASQQESERRSNDLEDVVEMLHDIPQFREFFFTPHLAKSEKVDLLKKIFEGKFDPLLSKFILCLLEKGRLKYLPEISKRYHQKVKEHLGIVEVFAITAVPLDEEVKKSLREKLQKFYGKTIEIKEVVRPGIIGGIILRIGNRRLDYSIADRLKKLKNHLSTNGY